MGNQITVGLGTDSTGALASTAAQVVDAINASSGASALVKALTYRGSSGSGVAPATEKVGLSDFLSVSTAIPASGIPHDNSHVQRGPFTQKVMRIGKHRDGSKVGVYLFCQQHAREWVTPITCLETAERLLRNYAIDPLTKDIVDNLDIFILPSVNPDGAHYSFYNFQSQRRNMTNHCVHGSMQGDDPMAPDFWTPKVQNNGATPTNTDPDSRNAWGVDLNRNQSEGTIFDGYVGASHSCTSDVFAGPSEVSEPEALNEKWVVDVLGPNIKFSNNIHTSGGYFMWAPGAYTSARETLPAPNIGIEKYFFAAAETVLGRIKQYRGNVVLPQRTGPIADVLYSAAGNSADDNYYRKGIIGYSFEAGSDVFVAPTLTVAATAGATGIRVSSTSGMGANDMITVGWNGPNPEQRRIASIVSASNPNPNVLLTEPLASDHAVGEEINGGTAQSGVGFFPDYDTEGKHEANEFAWGNFGLLEAALAYSRDDEAPEATMTGDRYSTGDPLRTTFEYVNEPSVIYYTTDGSTPTFSSPKWERQGLRRPGEVFEFTETTTVKWLAEDLAGNTSTGEATFVIDNEAPTTTASFSPPEQGGYYRNPTITLSATDNGDAGIEKTEYSLDGGSLTLYSGPFQVTGDGDHTLSFFSTDKAGNVEAPVSVSFKVDGTKPAISITKPADGASYLIDSYQKASYSCSDALSGLASCVGTVPNGSKFSTGSIGKKTFTVNAADNAGNTASQTVKYNVIWPFTGFLGLSMTKANKVKAGKEVEIRFKLGGFRGWDVIEDGYPISYRVSCSSVSSKAAKGKRNLKHHDHDHGHGHRRDLDYDDGVYEYEWDTSKSWDDTCRVFVLKLEDGTVHEATFRFK
jgi:hypothetical protein